jgi:3-hydroxyisobutyrate dehydrogenase-like beta-hydroxyacid dehydrogenase
MGSGMARNLAEAGMDVTAWVLSVTAATAQSVALAQRLGIDPNEDEDMAAVIRVAGQS